MECHSTSRKTMQLQLAGENTCRRTLHIRFMIFIMTILTVCFSFTRSTNPFHHELLLHRVFKETNSILTQLLTTSNTSLRFLTRHSESNTKLVTLVWYYFGITYCSPRLINSATLSCRMKCTRTTLCPNKRPPFNFSNKSVKN